MRPASNDNLRWCERLKSSIVYNHVEAFGKKFRKKKDFENQLINVNAQQREIDAFYKVGWQYQHAHSCFSSDISDPIYMQQKPSEGKDEQLTKYYSDCINWLQRLKIEHEDETTFRINPKYSSKIPFISQQNSHTNSEISYKKMHQNILCAKYTYRNIILNLQKVLTEMITNIEKEQANQFQYSKVYEIYQIIVGWLQYYKGNHEEGMFQRNSWLEEQADEIISIHCYVANFVSMAQSITTTKTSGILNIQPMVDALTLLIHPALLGIYGFYRKQQILWQNEYEHNLLNINYNKEIQEKHLLPQTQQPQISRVVFINLDGYESEYNIELVKNLHKHVLYISFPVIGGGVENITFNNRFMKKIFYNYCKDLYEYENQQYDVLEQRQDDDDEEYHDIRRYLEQQFDPEKYFNSISKLYSNQKTVQSNSNLYIFPLTFQYLEEQFSNLFTSNNNNNNNNHNLKNNMEKYYSYFVYFLLDQFIFDDIRKFNPNLVVLSYSAIFNINEQHWVHILKQLALISQRKIMFCPNFTSKFTDKLKQDYNYDNYIRNRQNLANSCNMELMAKMSQFLKISSGTYNLETPKNKYPLISRYKLTKINHYIGSLLNVLSSQQFQHLKNRISQIIHRVDHILLTRSIQESQSEFKLSIPAFYRELFAHIRTILLYPYNHQKYPREVGAQVLQIKECLNKFVKMEQRQAYVGQIVRELQLSMMEQKYSDLAYVYFKTKLDKVEFGQLKQELGQKQQQISEQLHRNKRITNNLEGLYSLSLKYTGLNKQKILIPIYPHTELLYRQNQNYKCSRVGKKTANIMIMNHLISNEFVSYAGIVNLIQSHQSDKNKQKIPIQRIEMYPIIFNNMPVLPFPEYKIRSNWNYAETNRYYILYWPHQCNILQKKLKQLKDQIYEPHILNEMYVCQIPTSKQYRLIFNRANLTDQDVVLRRFCNSLSLIQEDKIFILGGFYEKENNYLALQTQITGVDLSNYNNENFKCSISNEKGVLYGSMRERTKTNSYVRARRQYEIFQLSQLCDLEEEQMDAGSRQMPKQNIQMLIGDRQMDQIKHDNIKIFILIGGIGEEFVRPFSLLGCNYYQIKIDIQQKTIISIQRRMVYEKLLTANIRGFVKNNGYYDHLSFYDRNNMKPKQALGPQDYIAHRSIYMVHKETERGENRYELETKTKYLFGINLYPNSKPEYMKFAGKIGENIEDMRTNETSQFTLMLSPQGNHYLNVWKSKNNEENIQILLEKQQSKTTFQKVMLTHGSIISIDFKFQYIYAVIKHDLYTSGKYVLAQSEIIYEQTEIVLRIIKELQLNLEQYWLFIPRPTQVLLLHGITFQNVKISDLSYRINRKQGSKQAPLKSIIFQDTIDSSIHRKCLTMMTKDETKQTKTLSILSTNIIFFQNQRLPNFLIKQYSLQMETQSTDFIWQNISNTDITLLDHSSYNPITIARIQSIRQLQLRSQSQVSLPEITSANLSSQLSKSQGNIFFFKIMSGSNKQFIWLINSKSLEVKEDKLKFYTTGAQNKEIKIVWDLARPIKFHIKSLNKYQDLEII